MCPYTDYILYDCPSTMSVPLLTITGLNHEVNHWHRVSTYLFVSNTKCKC